MDLLKRKPNRIAEYDYSQTGAYFITICTHNRKKMLSKIVGTPLPGCPHEAVQLLWHGEIADGVIRRMDAFYANVSVERYVVMPDHVHLLICINEPTGHPRTGVPTRTSVIARFVGTFKRFCNKEYGENIWQSRYYDHVIRNQQDYNEVWEYIENNPRKWLLQKQGEE